MQGAMQILCANFRLTNGEECIDDEGESYNGWRRGWRKAQSPLIRFVVDLLYNKLYNKSTTNRISGV